MIATVLDAIDSEILRQRTQEWNERPIRGSRLKTGPRVGDFVELPDGRVHRFSHDWGDRLQHSATGSFYFGYGFMDFSGALNDGLPLGELHDTGKTSLGAAWFFHHDRHCAHNGIDVMVECRVYEWRPVAVPETHESDLCVGKVGRVRI